MAFRGAPATLGGPHRCFEPLLKSYTIVLARQRRRGPNWQTNPRAPQHRQRSPGDLLPRSAQCPVKGLRRNPSTDQNRGFVSWQNQIWARAEANETRLPGVTLGKRRCFRLLRVILWLDKLIIQLLQFCQWRWRRLRRCASRPTATKMLGSEQHVPAQAEQDHSSGEHHGVRRLFLRHACHSRTWRDRGICFLRHKAVQALCQSYLGIRPSRPMSLIEKVSPVKICLLRAHEPDHATLCEKLGLSWLCAKNCFSVYTYASQAKKKS